jgi:ABC-type lipoprotein export system ATPase subunit
MKRSEFVPLIYSRSLTRTYLLGNTTIHALNAVDIDIHEGELVVLKGDSGSGKSTLLSLLAGLDVPSGGELRVAGHDLRHAAPGELNRFRRNIIGMVFQSFNLLPTLNVIENVSLPALIAGRPYQETLEQAEKWLKWLGLENRRQHLPSQLSGGEMQRTAIARSLINEPKIILADEPTGNLDSHNGQVVMQLLAELNERWRRTLIIATHSELADSYADRHIRLKDGAVRHDILCRR